MITKNIAMQCPAFLYHKREKSSDGTPVRARSSGKCKIWKTRPNDFKLPVKHGLYGSFYIQHITNLDGTTGTSNNQDWVLTI